MLTQARSRPSERASSTSACTHCMVSATRCGGAPSPVLPRHTPCMHPLSADRSNQRDALHPPHPLLCCRVAAHLSEAGVAVKEYGSLLGDVQVGWAHLNMVPCLRIGKGDGRLKPISQLGAHAAEGSGSLLVSWAAGLQGAMASS